MVTVPMGVPNSWLYTVETVGGPLTVRSFKRFDVGACVEVFTAGTGSARGGALEPAEATVSSAQGC